MPKYVLTDDDRTEILSKSDVFTAKQLAEQYGCSRSTILKLWMDNNYHKPLNFCYYVNNDYFSTIDSANKAYVVGLIASDGNLYKRSGHDGQLRISMQDRSSENMLLRSILDDMCATHPIKRNHKTLNGKTHECISITIVSEQIYQDLFNIGITPQKTWKMDIGVVLKHIPKQFVPDFFRGYFDGDGSITSEKRNINKPSGINVSIAMPLKNAKILLAYLSKYNIEAKIQEDKRKYTDRFANLCFFGANKYIFLKWIYYQNCMCLQRKYDMSINYFKLVENNVTNRRENIEAVDKYNIFSNTQKYN